MTRGEFAIIAATVLVVLAVFLWIAVDKPEGIEPGAGADCIVGGGGVEGTRGLSGSIGSNQTTAGDYASPNGDLASRTRPRAKAGNRPTAMPCVELPAGIKPGPPPIPSESNRTGRAAEREVPSAASARRLPRGADAKLAQARLVCFRVTAYCPCEKCCSAQFADGITASGTRADHPLVAAPREFPFGTVMTIPGYGRVEVEDRGGAIRGNRLDVLFTDHESALQWGVQYLDVEVMR